MRTEFEYVLRLLKAAIYNEETPLPDSEIDWQILCEIAEEQKLVPVLYAPIKKLPQEAGIPSGALERWKAYSVMSCIGQQQKDECLKAVLRRAEEKGIRMLPFKGIALSTLYPVPSSRLSIDADCLISASDTERVAELMAELGYSISPTNFNENEDTYYNNILAFEIHTRLWEESSGERYEQLCALEIGKPENDFRLEMKGWEIKTLNPQETLIYLFYHMIKHFFLSGIGLRYLCDMTLFINKYAKEISWERFWDEAEMLGYTRFCRSFMNLCIDYTGLSADLGNGFRLDESERELATRILADMEEGGHNGRKSAVRAKAGRMVELYYNKKSAELPKTKLQMIKRLFSRKNWELENNRASQREYSTRSVVAWIQFLILQIKNRIRRKEPTCSIRERLNCAQNRFSLIQDLDIVIKSDNKTT